MKPIAMAAITVAALIVTGAVWAEGGDAHASTPPARLERPAHFQLANASASIDALVGRVLDALAKNDAGALHRLRVTEDEYRTFIIPGSVKPGEAPQVLEQDASEQAWAWINTNSIYAVQNIIAKYGGHKYRVKQTEFAKGDRQYAWYKAYKVVDLTLEDETGKEGELVLGSIADVDGQFKFIGLLGNL
jgi:hypothetical protein